MKRPNILFVFADQLRRQSLGFMGDEQVLTPNLDAFAKESLVFNNAISSCPLCSPYRGCLFTGKYPLSNGVFTNCKTGLDMMLSEKEICFSDILHEQGYYNGYIGKWHLDNPERNHSSVPLSGAKDWDAYTPPGEKRHHFDYWYSYGANDEHLSPHYWEDTPEQIKIDKWSVEHETDKAIEYINQHKEKPFSLFVALNPPHSPYDLVPEKYLELYKNKVISFRENIGFEKIHCHTLETFDYKKEDMEKMTKAYFAAITGIDEHFGRLIQALKDNAIEEDTLIIFTSDHGDMLGSHHLMAKHVWYEESIGVPFVIQWKNSALKKGITDIVLESTDIMPTLLGLMDRPIPKSIEGKDISKYLVSEEVLEENKVGFLCAFPGREIFLEVFREQDKNPLDFGWRGIRSKDYTFIIELGYHPEETIPQKYLYDLKKDPYQLKPIHYTNPAYQEVIGELEKQLMQWLQEQEDGICQYIV